MGCKPKSNSLLTEYKNKAYNDIKADSVKMFGFGLPLPPRDSLSLLRINKKTVIYEKYGLFKENLGCIVGDKEMDKATTEYHKITGVYLKKRNGKGWEERMQKEIDNIN